MARTKKNGGPEEPPLPYSQVPVCAAGASSRRRARQLGGWRDIVILARPAGTAGARCAHGRFGPIAAFIRRGDGRGKDVERDPLIVTLIGRNLGPRRTRPPGRTIVAIAIVALRTRSLLRTA